MRNFSPLLSVMARVRSHRFFASLLAACAASLAMPAAATAAPTQFTVFDAPRELKGGDDALRIQTLDELRSLGVDWLRITLYWKDVAPAPDQRTAPPFDERDPKEGYDWQRYDSVIQQARGRGMRILMTVSGPVPKWATRAKRDYRTNPSAARFERFVTAVGRRYGDDVSIWAIWNEPNQPNFLLPQFRGGRAASPAIYRRLFLAADRGLRAAGQGDDPILAGETAPLGTDKVVAPLTFLRGALCLDHSWTRSARCSRLPADGWAHHPYTTKVGPWFVPRRSTDVTIGVLGRLNRSLARAERADALRAGTGIYITEFGVQSEPDPNIGVSQPTQAEYRSIAEQMAARNPRVRSFSQYLMRDDFPRVGVPISERYRGFESGLRMSNGEPKLAYEGFRLPLVALRTATRTSLWGLVRPARAATAVVLDYRDGAGPWRQLKMLRTTESGSWTTSTPSTATRRYRVRWAAADGTVHIGPSTRSYVP